MDFDIASLDFRHLYLASVLMVTIAEMGDKTQLLAMAFATRFRPWKVIMGVFFSTILINGLGVWVGTAIASFNSCSYWLQLIAALLFIFFGLWTLKDEKLEGEEKRVTRFGPILTVAIAFFISELGDKTQLTTINLTILNPRFPLAILVGTTTGMLIADTIGIIVGIFLAKRIPERVIKLISAGFFICFGIFSTRQVLLEDFAMRQNEVLCLLSLVVLATLTGMCLILKGNRKVGLKTRVSSAKGSEL